MQNVNFWAKVKLTLFMLNTGVIFGELLENLGLLFNLASGHSAREVHQ